MLRGRYSPCTVLEQRKGRGMSEKISRRDFLKVAGAGIAAGAILTGCGPDSRYVKRTPYTKMPEYTYNGLSTFYATTCRECPAGCGMVVRTMQGRALKVEGNPNHPVNLGKTCSRGQASLQGLYNPDRLQGPFKQSHGGGNSSEVTWDEAVCNCKRCTEQFKSRRNCISPGVDLRSPGRPGQ